MGCFSYLCKKCGKGILSNSARGERVRLFLLRNGSVIEEMEGEYNSYGRVFTEDLKGSIEWIGNDKLNDLIEVDKALAKAMGMESSRDVWNFIVELHFNGNREDGIAAIHSKCFKEGDIPTEQSEDDPDQGWGEDLEYYELV